MDSVQNLRDMGGYYNRRGTKSTRWGQIYRSGQINALSDSDTVRLDKLKIKTIIDLRTEEEAALLPITYSKAVIVHVPVSLGDLNEITQRMEEGRIRKRDGILFMEDMYLRYITGYNGQFAKALAVFSDENNYPVLFCGSSGKDRTGFLAALLLLALGMPEHTIMSDYMTSNDYLDIKRYELQVQQYSSDAQEALTAIITANESFLDLALMKIKKDYGSVDNYLRKELNFTEKEQNKLKEIILF
jgi:protein-tyrosine phosphatase